MIASQSIWGFFYMVEKNKVGKLQNTLNMESVQLARSSLVGVDERQHLPDQWQSPDPLGAAYLEWLATTPESADLEELAAIQAWLFSRYMQLYPGQIIAFELWCAWVLVDELLSPQGAAFVLVDVLQRVVSGHWLAHQRFSQNYTRWQLAIGTEIRHCLQWTRGDRGKVWLNTNALPIPLRKYSTSFCREVDEDFKRQLKISYGWAPRELKSGDMPLAYWVVESLTTVGRDGNEQQRKAIQTQMQTKEPFQVLGSLELDIKIQEVIQSYLLDPCSRTSHAAVTSLLLRLLDVCPRTHYKDLHSLVDVSIPIST
ncbi:unnamed protein product [Amoebophrya sp. A25]|nr:unnamed protein product [Amoebophrya sp. A25]|eukprot:GSA25T00015967001.1